MSEDVEGWPEEGGGGGEEPPQDPPQPPLHFEYEYYEVNVLTVNWGGACAGVYQGQTTYFWNGSSYEYVGSELLYPLFQYECVPFDWWHELADFYFPNGDYLVIQP